jgi:uncharacterized membrane protein YjgN (DUF898 family)
MDMTSNAGNAPATQTHHFEFTGTGGEYFRIWIVNLLLTLITFGIYGAWAKVRRLRYFYGSTLLAGSSFEYHGEPKKILKGRLIAGALILPYYLLQHTYALWSLLFLAAFVIALPFIIVQSRRFQMRMTSWRNIHFGFVGTYGQAAKLYLGLSALIPLTLGLLFPYVHFAKQRFIIGETMFGKSKLAFHGRPGRYVAAYAAAYGWSIIAVIVLMAALSVVGIFKGDSTFDSHQLGTMPTSGLVGIIGIFIIYLVLVSLFLIPHAITTARISNHAFSSISLDNNQVICNLSQRELYTIYLTNLIGITFTLGLFSPWAKIRLLRYQLENTTLAVHGNLDAFVASESANVSAAGEEIGDFLDVDFGL